MSELDPDLECNCHQSLVGLLGAVWGLYRGTWWWRVLRYLTWNGLLLNEILSFLIHLKWDYTRPIDSTGSWLVLSRSCDLTLGSDWSGITGSRSSNMWVSSRLICVSQLIRWESELDCLKLENFWLNSVSHFLELNQVLKYSYIHLDTQSGDVWSQFVDDFGFLNKVRLELSYRVTYWRCLEESEWYKDDNFYSQTMRRTWAVWKYSNEKRSWPRSQFQWERSFSKS